MPTTDNKQQELESLRQRVERLEAELAGPSDEASDDWRRADGYFLYYATTGFFLGMIAACTSLLFNVVGAVAVGKHPLQLIRIYLTFGLGENALRTEGDNGLILAVGCCLYIGTGMLLGVPFQLVLNRFASRRSLAHRLAVASVLAIVLWLVSYYAILSWLQPLLYGGNWIVREIPVWVAALTHLVFGGTMAIVYPWGMFEPYRRLRL